MRHTPLLGLATLAVLAGCHAPTTLSSSLESIEPTTPALEAAPPAAAASEQRPSRPWKQHVDESWLRLQLDFWWAGAEGVHKSVAVEGEYIDPYQELEDMDPGGRLRAEIGTAESRWKLIADATGYFPEQDFVAKHTESTLLIGEVDVAYRPGGLYGYELLAGLRYGQLETDVTGSAPGELDDEWLEPVLGLRGPLPLSETVTVRWRFDMGGFGIDDGTTFQVDISLQWKLSRVTEFVIGGRYLSLDIENIDDSGDEIDMDIGGPYVGLAFKL